MTHKRGDEKCEACRDGYPVKCAEGCGGLVHASKGCVIETACDRCPPEEPGFGKPDNHDQY